MEPLFQIEYYDNFKMIREFYRRYHGPTPIMLIVFWSIIAVFFVYCLMLDILLPVLDSVMWLVLIMALMSFMPEFLAAVGMHNSKKQNDGVQPKTVVTFTDIIQMDEGMVHLTIEYRKIVKVVHLKHSYVLMLGKRNGVILDPNGFTKGTFEEFKQFLRTKRPDLTIPE